MAVSRNRVDIMGYLGGDAELTFQTDFSVLKFSVAVSEKWTDNAGNKKEHTEWFRCVMMEKFRSGATGPRSAFLSKALEKGKAVSVVGQLRQREYEDKDGVKRWFTEVRAHEIQLLDRNPVGQGGTPRDFDYGGVDDIPF